MQGVSQDFMPLEGWDHIELWVGNAKQCAYYYEQAFGFQPIARRTFFSRAQSASW